jgi:FkbM family methyltransferase
MIQGSREIGREFKGRFYRQVAVDRMAGDPSWYSFDDEQSVRQEFWNIGEGDLVFDIGAAYGSYAITALLMGASHVFAWSPQGHPGSPDGEKEADFLRSNAEINGWADRCSVYEEGLFDRAGWLHTETQEFFPLEGEKPPPHWGIIPVRPFGEWFDAEFVAKGFRLNSPKTWVKIDVEGAELEVLRGLRLPLIAPASPNLLIENHNFKRGTLEDEVRQLVTGWGYHEVATRPYHSVSHSFYVA